MAQAGYQSLAPNPDPGMSARGQSFEADLDGPVGTTGRGEVHDLFGDWNNDHPVNLRLRIPLPSSRFCVTTVKGRERRSAQRRAEERENHPIETTGNVALRFVAGTTVGIGLFTVVQRIGNWALAQIRWITP